VNHGDGDGDADADAFSLLVRLKCRLRSNCRTPTAGELQQKVEQSGIAAASEYRRYDAGFL